MGEAETMRAETFTKNKDAEKTMMRKKKKKKRRRARKSFRFRFALCCPHLPASLPSFSPPLRKDHPWWQLYLFKRFYASKRSYAPHLLFAGLTFYLPGSPYKCD